MTAGFIYYKSFFNYWNDIINKNPNAIYENFDNIKEGEHSVKIIGWGIEQETNKKYWLCVNSWGKSYTDGVFRFIRGINDCEIESYVSAGYVDKIIYSIDDFIYIERDIFLSFQNLDKDYE